jgi:hypothetical protein
MPEFLCPHCGGALLIDAGALGVVSTYDLCAEIGRRRRRLVRAKTGPKVSCECGKCQKCKMRLWKQAQRARQKKAENSA